MPGGRSTGRFLQLVLSGLSTRSLAWLAGALFVIDLFVPDPIPLVDEVLLGLLTLILSRRPSRPAARAPHGR